MTAPNQSYGPRYYNRGSIEVWDFIRDQRLNYHLGNAVKYICRYGHKGDYNDQLSDLKKAIHYLENERDFLQRSRNREDLPGHYASDSIVFTGSGIQGGLSDYRFPFPSSEGSSEGLDCGGVQGVPGFGSSAVSFKPEE
tara:strand:- start:53 stop:469 length:417 start_codon:yes stop_codon:yes gene_type:complete